MITRGRKLGNDTIDVANKGCFDTYDTLACARSSLLTTAAAITLIFVILKIVKYHVYRHQQIHHYAIFYVSALECLVCGTSFMAGSRLAQLDFAASFLKLLQFALVCHLHWSLAARALRRDDLLQHLVNPVLCLYVLYCTTVALMGMVDVTDSWTQCMRPYWLMLSSADFVIVQVFIASAIYIHHRIEGISTLACFKSSEKRDLWSVVIVYDISAIITVVFDAVMRFVGSEEDGCSALFGHTQVFYSTVLSVFVIAKFLLPVWTVLYMLHPTEGDTHISEVALASRYSMDGSSDPVSSIRGYHQYRRMFLPPGESDLPPSMPNGDPVLRLPFVSDFSSLSGSFGEYPYPSEMSPAPGPPASAPPAPPPAIHKKGGTGMLMLPPTTGLSTICEETDSTREGSLRSERGVILCGSGDTPRKFGLPPSC